MPDPLERLCGCRRLQKPSASSLRLTIQALMHHVTSCWQRSSWLIRLLGDHLRIDEGNDGSSFVGGAAGNGGLSTFAGRRPAEIADVPLAAG